MKVIAVMKLIHRNGSCLMNCTYNRIIQIIRLFGFRIGLLYVIRAKILRETILQMQFHGLVYVRREF